MNAPLVIFAYKRADHLRTLLDSLERCDGKAQTALTIFCDGSKGEKDRDGVAQVAQLVRGYAKASGFASVDCRVSPSNKGLAASVIAGVTEIVEKYGRVIVAEDDLEVSADFLRYMNDALDFYERDRKIWSVSGYSFQIDALKNYAHEVYMTYRACSWGWATWADRWAKIDWSAPGYRAFRFNIFRRLRFCRSGLDMAHMLDTQIDGLIDSWAIRWCYAQFLDGSLCVYPKSSRVRNTGMDGSGTHSPADAQKPFAAVLNTSDAPCVFEHLGVERRVNREFRRRYVSLIDILYMRYRYWRNRFGI